MKKDSNNEQLEPLIFTIRGRRRRDNMQADEQLVARALYASLVERRPVHIVSADSDIGFILRMALHYMTMPSMPYRSVVADSVDRARIKCWVPLQGGEYANIFTTGNYAHKPSEQARHNMQHVKRATAEDLIRFFMASRGSSGCAVSLVTIPVQERRYAIQSVGTQPAQSL